MAYRDLSQTQMISLSDALLSLDTQIRLSQEPLLAPLVVKLSEINQALKSHTLPSTNLSAEIQALTQQLDTLDALHDRKMRGTYYALKAALEGCDDPTDAADLADALQLLFPDGLSVVIASYQVEGGRAQLIENILDDDTEALLASLSLKGATAATWLRQAIDAAKTLAAKDIERARLSTPSTPATPATPSTSLQDISRQWINLIKSFDRLAPLSTLSSEEARVIFGPLRDAAKAAGKK
jgi:hypothetical protein